ncbi:MAG: prepilin-type N-terminal cleavage/methylation domain-containing protein [Candidatus Dojkabacteria bacterium]|jgi:Tfp pilus assembly protein FimT|nr:prepilin-type N-terminal cleavage/methylation domain-containing protein [Candidatus Dojkabacteria bacterium]
MVKSKNKNNLKGFSLFELIITMGILMILSLIVFPIAIQKAQESKLESYASQMVTDIYYQQQRSAIKNSPEGVSFSTNEYTLFDGETLLGATETDTKKYPINIDITSINMTNGSTVSFPAGEFKPASYGTVILTDGITSVRVYINREGLIGYEKL